ncbi:unnamed protein product [Aphis gossypii]|uniref:Uncharacterized protein n=1 Tax=Aphis gossypii TaxID=80765 RepID=A0A9P0JAY0_APHGO|nr:unnamed protein product [Aphis gossypii]
MDRPPAPSFDPALLDMENMTADKWYTLIYNRTVQQEDIFVGDFKKKITEIINTCMNKPNTTIENLKQDITNTINESQFEFEHQKFIDGIVGGTYEYLCQFIIKNSMENIKRTQCALSCFSLTNNLNDGAIKPCCNENILLQESSKLSQIQCSPESNNNTTDTDKAIQSYLFNNSENDQNSILVAERDNVKNTTTNKLETTAFQNYREALQVNNLFIESTNNTMFNNISINNNQNTAHSSVIIDDDDKTTQAIISLAMKIQQTTFHEDIDYFEANEINDSTVCINNEIQTTKAGFIEQNGDKNTDPLKLEEEYKINNSLKLLESLVNIEHDKLKVQKSPTKNEIQPNIEKSEKNLFKSSKKTIIVKKKNRRLQGIINKEEEDEWLPSDEKQKNHCLKNKHKKKEVKRSQKDKVPKKYRKLESPNILNNLSTSTSSCSVTIQGDQSPSLTMNVSSISSYTKKSETIVSTVKNTKSLDTTTSAGTQLAYQNVKDCLPTANNLDMLSNKTCPIASTSGYNEKNIDNLKNKLSSPPTVSAMKTLDYKKIYEKDRKSLFSPDIIITNNVTLKSPKDDLHIKKEHNSIQKKEDPEKKPDSKICKVKNNNKSSNKKKRSVGKELISKVKITDNSSKLTHNSKSKPNHASTTKNKFKRIKFTESDDKVKTNAVSNKNKISNTSDILENKVSGNIDTLDPQESNRTNILENNISDQGTSKNHQLKVQNKEEVFKIPLFDENTPEWLRHLITIHNIKPVCVSLNKVYFN